MFSIKQVPFIVELYILHKHLRIFSNKIKSPIFINLRNVSGQQKKWCLKKKKKDLAENTLQSEVSIKDIFFSSNIKVRRETTSVDNIV